jgi:hypothetical protein
MRLRTLMSILAAAGLAAGSLGACSRGPSRDRPTVEPRPTPTSSRTAVEPKPLSQTITAGLAWLAKHQLPGGGWGQGDESAHMGDTSQMRDTANVADTSMALLAFLRSGNTARAGDYQDAVHRGLDYVLSEIEASDDTSLAVTSISGTRVQAKIGTYADTFAALMMLNEARGGTRDGVAAARVDKAIRKIVRKIEKNQRPDGGFDDHGWAPVLAQAMAAKALNRSAQNGFHVPDVVLERVAAKTTGQYNAATMTFDAAEGAGVELYGAAAAAPARDAATTQRAKAAEMKQKGDKKRKTEAPQSPDAPTAAEIREAEAKAARATADAEAIEGAMIARMEDAQFIAGFGNNGGEEFLSHLLIGESLALRGGDEWSRWDAAITKLVDGIQNDDGSWTGHHCITGRTFCTAAALLVLMADRTPVPEILELAE